MIKTIIFDIDQTMYDYWKCHAVSLHNLDERCKELFGFEAGTVKKWWTIIFHEIYDRLGYDNVCTHETALRIQTILERNGVNPILHTRELHNRYWDDVVEMMEPFPGLIDFIKEAKRQGIRLGIATDLLVEIQLRKLEKLGVIEFFDFFVTSEEAGCEKPHKGIFECALKKAGCKPEECLMIGDNWDKDIVGAIDMGMQYAWCIPEKDLSQIEPERLPVAFQDYELLKRNVFDI